MEKWEIKREAKDIPLDCEKKKGKLIARTFRGSQISTKKQFDIKWKERKVKVSLQVWVPVAKSFRAQESAQKAIFISGQYWIVKERKVESMLHSLKF